MTDFPRALSDEEGPVLEFLLRPDFAGVEALRRQVDHAKVRGVCSCGCPSFGIEVDKSRGGPAEFTSHGAPDTDADSIDDNEPYSLLLFTDDGWLDYVELVWYGKSPPSIFPSLSKFNPARPLH